MKLTPEMRCGDVVDAAAYGSSLDRKGQREAAFHPVQQRGRSGAHSLDLERAKGEGQNPAMKAA